MHKGSFEPLIMYFGLCNSPATFQKMMNEIFHDMSDVCIVYINDLMIFTPMDNQEAHDRIVLEVLRHLRDVGQSEGLGQTNNHNQHNKGL